ncbi:MAG: FAD-dependent oxidoreductase [Rhodobacteraceae bacterium]|nr:FAD-dependent oxidoreductase [Paracoccaceae bacterium]
MDEIIIIGSGMAGITCARTLADADRSVRVLDKGRGIGGRMATRSVATAAGGLTFDHGAQYLRPRDPAFAQMLAQAGARPWPDGPDHGRQVGMPGMSGVPRAQADGLTVMQQTEVTAIAWRDGVWHLSTSTCAVKASRVILTIPGPQVTALLDDTHPFAADLARVVMEPCLTLMAAFPPDSPRPFTNRLDPSHPLAWIAQDSTKPGRPQSAVTWVAQASAAFSRERLEAGPDDIAARMLPLLAGVLDVDPALALYARAHRWRYAQASAPLGRPFLCSSDRTLYAGGDWCLGARAEVAWHSGRAIARDILDGADVD